MTSPASMVLPRPTSSASRRFARGWLRARRSGSSWYASILAPIGTAPGPLGVRTGDGSPPEGVDERGEPLWLVEPLRIDLGRQILLGSKATTWLELPDDPELVAQPVVLDGLKTHCMLELLPGVVLCTPRQALLLDIGHRPVRPSDGDDLADLRDGLGRPRSCAVLLPHVDGTHSKTLR